jgi:hypothetical protein
LGKEPGGIIVRQSRELSRKYQGSAENGLGRGQIGELMGRGAEGEEKPRKVAGPVG